MKPILLLIISAVFVLTFTACHQEADSPPDLTQLKAEIQALSDEWAAALNTRDIKSLMDLYADDAISMPDMNTSLTGKEAILKHQKQEWAQRQSGLTHAFETVDVYAQGNVVTEFGLTTIKDAKGKLAFTGKYMCLWEKQDGRYRCIREIYNSDQAPSPAAEKSIHLFDMPTDLAEAELSGALAEMNKVIAGLGYPGAGYYMYKTSDAEITEHQHYFEGIWPSAEAYTKIHQDPAYVAASEKLGPLYDKIRTKEIYRRVSLVP
jgi:uncharacterized protein (TIGR02246 family)